MASLQQAKLPFKFLDHALLDLLAPSSGGRLSPDQLLSFRNALLDALPIPLLVTSERDEVLFVNQALLNLLQCAENFPLGKRLAAFLAPQTQPLASPFSELMEEKEEDRSSEPFTLLRPNGDTVPVQKLSRPMMWNGCELTVSALFDLTEHRDVNEHLLQFAYNDRLTGLQNRDCFLDSLAQEIRRLSGSEGYSFSVLLLDIDRFKLLNEQFGTDIADKVLIEVTERTKSILHGFASIFRTGGNELAAILRGVDSKAYVESTLSRLQKLISLPVWVNGDSVFPSACLTAMLDVPKGLSALQVMGRLSAAMKVAKKRGVGYALFVPPAGDEEGTHISPHREGAVRLSEEIQTSLLDSRFVPYFQPIYNTTSMQLIGFETLARWQHPDSGVLLPSAFLSEAEESGLVTAIDKAIVSQAISAMETFTRKNPDLSFFISANTSGLSLKDPSFMDFIRSSLGKASFPPDRFVLEITEDILVENLAEIRGRLENLKKLDIRVALDDFGTGYSSLQYISQLPIDCIKIDRSFIEQLFKSKKTMSLVKTIIEMARSLDLDIIAEGIETKDQNLWLADFKVDGQGYFFSTPLSMEKTEEFLKDASVFDALFRMQDTQ